ncbi:MAG: ATP-binding cassette domain-containing protein [Gammaproteobacteria bacterium]|nr:ATP-binding cassette domain-containing protein [Gammaproteobacteria bacterium]
MEHMLAIDPTVREQEIRNHLGGFGFRGQALDPVQFFSGGERARLVLALLAWQRPALLLLDEPTNHLDIEMREALALALGEYAGAVVLVSHDRHLLRESMNEFWLVADGRVRPGTATWTTTPAGCWTGRIRPPTSSPTSPMHRRVRRSRASPGRTARRTNAPRPSTAPDSSRSGTRSAGSRRPWNGIRPF